MDLWRLKALVPILRKGCEAFAEALRRERDLFQQQAEQIAGNLPIIVPANVFVIDPWVAKREVLSLAHLRKSHDRSSLVLEQNPGIAGNPKRRDFDEIHGQAGIKNASRAARDENTLSGNFRVGFFAKLESKARGKPVEMLELGIAFVVSKQNKPATVMNPLIQRVDFTLLQIFRIVRFRRRVRIGNDENFDPRQHLWGQSLMDGFEFSTQALNYFSQL